MTTRKQQLNLIAEFWFVSSKQENCRIIRRKNNKTKVIWNARESSDRGELGNGFGVAIHVGQQETRWNGLLSQPTARRPTSQCNNSRWNESTFECDDKREWNWSRNRRQSYCHCCCLAEPMQRANRQADAHQQVAYCMLSGLFKVIIMIFSPK